MSTPVTIKNPAFVNDDKEAEINANFSLPIMVDTEALSWQRSPAAGVMRKRLELIGKHDPRLTTLVKFDPGSKFNKHGHDGGEEFLVLAGVFSDASGDYSAGCYIRNPPGTYHAPFTVEGCTILVKLRQFQSLDSKQLVIDTKAHTTRWSSTGEPGISRLTLHSFADETVSLYKMHPQCWTTFKKHKQGTEIFVYEGSVSDGNNDYQEGTWLRYPAASRVKISAPDGAGIYVKQGGFPEQ